MKEIIKKSIIGGIAFLVTVLAGGMLYAAIGSVWTNPTALEVGSGSGLTATAWNQLLANFNNLDSRMNTVNSRPIFIAYLNQTSSAAGNTWTKIPFNAVGVDTNSFFNTSTNRFQPTIAGYYNITLTALMSANGPGGTTMYSGIYKNGAIIKSVANLINYVGAFTQTLNVNSIVYMNGTTDYIEGNYMYNGNPVNLVQGSAYTYMQGFFLRP